MNYSTDVVQGRTIAYAFVRAAVRPGVAHLNGLFDILPGESTHLAHLWGLYTKSREAQPDGLSVTPCHYFIPRNLIAHIQLWITLHSLVTNRKISRSLTLLGPR